MPNKTLFPHNQNSKNKKDHKFSYHSELKPCDLSTNYIVPSNSTSAAVHLSHNPREFPRQK